jgi:DNA processing protein
MGAAHVTDDVGYWLTLAASRISGELGIALIETFGSVAAVVDAGPSGWARRGIDVERSTSLSRALQASVDQTLAWLEKEDCRLVTVASDDYPGLLREIAGAPLLLYVHGNIEALHLPSLAVVGSRNPTRAGLQNAYDFARHLGGAGVCIVSGLAQGIDTAAHRGALDAEAKTIAVLGHGIDRVYPAANRDLAHRIVEQGAMVSEYPLGSAPRKEHFPARNRLISGCSMGTLVVEAARRSGSLITARLASEQGREVFAIPGSIHNALSRGCHQLIRSGAKLVESADDIVSELAPIASHLMQNEMQCDKTPIMSNDRDDQYKLLKEILGHDPATADEIADKSGLTIEQVSSMLLILELEGEIEALNGGQYSLLRSSSWHERERTRRTDVPF